MKTIIDFIIGQKKIPISTNSLRRSIQCVRKNNFDTLNKAVVTRREVLRACITKDPENVDVRVSESLPAIFEAFPSIKNLRDAYQKFYSALMGDQVSKLDEFLEEFSENSGLKGFMEGIRRDITAVKNAITLPISSGVVEGYNNKLKYLKRIVFGRTNLVNLEQRCRLAFWLLFSLP